MKPFKHWIFRLMIASNQMVNALIGGDPQMSMSARAGFAREQGSKMAKVWCKLLDIPDIHHYNPMFPVGADHCDIAVINYFERKAELNP